MGLDFLFHVFPALLGAVYGSLITVCVKEIRDSNRTNRPQPRKAVASSAAVASSTAVVSSTEKNVATRCNSMISCVRQVAVDECAIRRLNPNRSDFVFLDVSACMASARTKASVCFKDSVCR